MHAQPSFGALAYATARFPENPNSLGVLHFRAHAQFTAVQHRSKHTTTLIALNRHCLYVYIKQ